ncbi:MAG: MFS transporter [Firmicutes bacterium]|nr:MFS transporter [Bacillota bacterium]
MNNLPQPKKISVFNRTHFPVPIGPVPFLFLGVVSQTSMSFIQQGVAVLGILFARQYHLSLAWLGFLVVAPSLGMMVGLIPVGWIVDRIGPRRLLFAITGPMAVLVWTVGQAPSVGLLWLALMAMGITFGAVPGVGTKAVFLAFAGRDRGLPMGIRQTGVPIGAALAAFLLPHWVRIWGITGVFDRLAIMVVGGSLGFAAVIPAMPRRTTTLHAVPVRQFVRALIFPALISMLLVGAQYDMLTFTIPDLMQRHGLTLALAGIVLAVAQIGGGLGRIGFGVVSDRVTGHRPRVLGWTAFIAGVATLAIALLPHRVPVDALLALWFVLGTGAVGWNALALTWAGESVPVEHAGLAMTTIAALIYVGAVLHPPLFGMIADHTGAVRYGWLWLSGCMGLALLLSVWKQRRRPPR